MHAEEYVVETGLYYLGSRYYDPETGRFINADVVEILDYDQNSLFENNLFAYCVNDPVNKKDVDGYFFLSATLAAIGTAVIAKAAIYTAAAGIGILVGCLTGKAISDNIKKSKGGHQNKKDTGLIGVSDEEIARRLKDPRTPKSEKEKLKTEQKARGNRNKQKRRR